MNTREIFNNFVNFNNNIRTLKCEFGFWGSAIGLLLILVIFIKHVISRRGSNLI